MSRDLLYEKKAPTSRSRYVGIEIECLTPPGTSKKLQDLLVKENLQWNVNYGGDGSVKDLDWVPRYEPRQGIFDRTPYPAIVNHQEEWKGIELRILATEKEAPDIINRTCAALAKIGAKVNKTCGLHVHLDMRDRDHETVYNNLYRFQALMFKMQPDERRQNKFCKKLTRMVEKPTERHVSINKMSYDKHRTLEVRLHEGTIDAKDIKSWTFFLINIANLTDKLKRSVNDLTKLSFPTSVKEYVDARVKIKAG